MDECILDDRELIASSNTYRLVERYLLNFDVMNKSGEEARELIAWLQLELKTHNKLMKEDSMNIFDDSCIT